MDSMVKKAEVLAIIPARGGSKGIPRKNVKDFAGYPLIAYSILAGIQSTLVTRTIVSTDDDEISAVAREYGAEVPFIRPEELARDNTTDFPVYKHALEWLSEHEDYRPDVVVQLRPTSPIRPLSCVDDAVSLLLVNPTADSVRGVVMAAQNPFKMWRIEPEGRMIPLVGIPGITEPYNAPRQVLPDVYWQTGHVDAIRPHVILDKQSMSGRVILPLIIDSKYTVDLDNPSDWRVAETLIRDGGLTFVDPANQRRTLPRKIKLLVMDFDGVLTDNRVWVNQNGEETVAANRSDSLGLALLKERRKVESLVISKERNPVVEARCRKINLPVLQGIDDKATILKQYLAEKGIDPKEVVYIGNDTNDLPCFPIVSFAFAPADAQPEVQRKADWVLENQGGRGAVRELCDILISRLQ
jgi:N-acylneuraminate cytidylyltransferase